MDRIIVHDGIDHFAGRYFAFDLVEEADKPLMSVVLHFLPEDRHSVDRFGAFLAEMRLPGLVAWPNLHATEPFLSWTSFLSFMAKFIVIDQSLRDAGGHHFDYDFHLLRAAQEMGFETVLGCHRRFRQFDLLPAGCRTIPIFRHQTYNRYSDMIGIRHIVGDWEKGKAVRRMKDWYKSRRHQRVRQRRKRINSFAQCSGQLFRQIDVTRGDHVLAPTLSELDLLGLAQFLRDAARPPDVDWHLQFHFDILDGREPDYDAQSNLLERIRVHFQDALGSAQGHRLHFYNTSRPLTVQYNRLNVASFEPLAYPVNPALRTSNDTAEKATDSYPTRQVRQPLQVTCAGGVRKEKGQAQLAALVHELWNDCLAAGEAQLIVQAKIDPRANTPEVLIPLPTGQEREGLNEGGSPVRYVPHPLAMEDYADLIRSADIGLIMYDSDRYYARWSGVLSEYLTAGVPVIVPAGCCLAEQIAEPIYRYQESLADTCKPVSDGGVSIGDWSCSGKAGAAENDDRLTFGVAADRLAGQFESPKGANALLQTFNWSASTPPGIYMQLHITQLDDAGDEVARSTTVVGRRHNSQASALVHLDSRAAVIRCQWSNAYHDSLVSLEHVRFRFLAEKECPLGAVGLIAASPAEVGRLLRDVIRHHAHYRATAREFAKDWYARHEPRATIRQLVQRADNSRLTG